MYTGTSWHEMMSGRACKRTPLSPCRVRDEQLINLSDYYILVPVAMKWWVAALGSAPRMLFIFDSHCCCVPPVRKPAVNQRRSYSGTKTREKNRKENDRLRPSRHVNEYEKTRPDEEKEMKPARSSCFAFFSLSTHLDCFVRTAFKNAPACRVCRIQYDEHGIALSTLITALQHYNVASPMCRGPIKSDNVTTELASLY